MSTATGNILEMIGEELQQKIPPIITTNHLNEHVETYVVADEAIEVDDTNKTVEIVESENNENISEECLKHITDTQTQLQDVKESLGKIIDAMAANPSYFSQASAYWGGLPLWEKIAGGVFVVGPTVAVGIALNIGVLLTIGGITGITYVAGGFILDDHHNCNAQTAERLKQGIFSLSDALQLTINALNTIHDKFAKEITRFQKENTRLVNNVDNLGAEVRTLTYQVECFMIIEQNLQKSKQEL